MLLEGCTGPIRENSKLSHFQNSVYAQGKQLVSEEEIEEFQHKFPFKGAVRMDPTSVNEQQVHLNTRRPSEFPVDAKLAFDSSYRARMLHHKKATTSPKRLEDS